MGRRLTGQYTFWARVTEFALFILFIDQLPMFENDCVFMSYACYGVAFSLFYHLMFFIFPWRGKLKYIRMYCAVTRPWSCFALLSGAFSGALSTYYSFFGGCPMLRDLCFLGAVPSLLYVAAWYAGESGECDLWGPGE
ncbi:unnamed protein product [Amoebophrya sp. A25]|nr:unnamed protein product [Amoebophrya sp. A25]|eukprot:GSA25T00023191001.1